MVKSDQIPPVWVQFWIQDKHPVCSAPGAIVTGLSVHVQLQWELGCIASRTSDSFAVRVGLHQGRPLWAILLRTLIDKISRCSQRWKALGSHLCSLQMICFPWPHQAVTSSLQLCVKLPGWRSVPPSLKKGGVLTPGQGLVVSGSGLWLRGEWSSRLTDVAVWPLQWVDAVRACYGEQEAECESKVINSLIDYVPALTYGLKFTRAKTQNLHISKNQQFQLSAAKKLLHCVAHPPGLRIHYTKALH